MRTDINRGIADAKESYLRDKQAAEQARRRARWPRIVTWALPGFGHLLQGACLRGLFILGLVGTTALMALDLYVIMPNPEATPGFAELVIGHCRWT